jgi:hypothetical protein
MAKRAVKKTKKLKSRKTPVYTIEGLPIRNLKTKLKLVISKQDCTRGAQKAPNACAAALAAVRQVPNCLEARVHINRIFLRIKDGAKEYWLRGKAPNSLRTEIATFDRGGTFDPGVYDINPLSPSEEPNGRANSLGAPKRGRHDHKRSKPHILKGIRGNALSEYRLIRSK